jgi:DNA-binding LacI/PurR family transcriptional regulator
MAEGLLADGERMPAEETLAERLDVSRTTIRRVLEDLERQGFIKVEGRRRTVSTISIQRKGSTIQRTIAMVSEGRHPRAVSQSPGWSFQIGLGVTHAVQAAGFHLLDLSMDKMDQQAIARLAAERVRGLVVFRHALKDAATTQLMQALHAARLPVVVYGYEPAMEAENTVASDHSQGEYLLTKLLIERGCRRILRMWPRKEDSIRTKWGLGWLDSRDEGYERAMTEAGLEILPPSGYYHAREWVEVDIDESRGFEMNMRMAVGYLAEHLGCGEIDGICAPSDSEAYVMAAACRRLGLNPDRDVLIVGYDNNWSDAPYRAMEASVPVATVDKQNFRMGQQLVELLLSRDFSKGAEPAEHRFVEPELVVIRDTVFQGRPAKK